MNARAVIAVAGSAGGVDALSKVIEGLPADLPAAVLVVLHVAPIAPSVLPAIINRHGRLPASHATDGEPLRAGRVYVAPPDHHLLVSPTHVRLERGPRENGNRPAADPLFRSVAESFGRRAAGVVLSGALDDGTAGLAAIKEAGGLTVVQDPEGAAFPGMPTSAVTFVRPAVVTDLAEIPKVLVHFAREASRMPCPNGFSNEESETEADTREQISEFTCPECGGTLWTVGNRPMRFKCRVGHAFSTESFALGKQEALESALWAAIVALEERADLARRLLRRTANSDSERLGRRYKHEIEESESRAAVLRRLASEMVGSMNEIGTPAGSVEGHG